MTYTITILMNDGTHEVYTNVESFTMNDFGIFIQNNACWGNLFFHTIIIEVEK